jgi:hypothetical protein
MFAALKEAHNSLPDETAERLPTPEHLRKFALIKTGFADSRSLACSSRAEALRIAAFMRPADEFSVVTIEGAVVTVWTAKSQSVRAMGKAEFTASKDAVLAYVASLIGTTTAALERHTREAA